MTVEVKVRDLRGRPSPQLHRRDLDWISASPPGRLHLLSSIAEAINRCTHVPPPPHHVFQKPCVGWCVLTPFRSLSSRFFKLGYYTPTSNGPSAEAEDSSLHDQPPPSLAPTCIPQLENSWNVWNEICWGCNPLHIYFLRLEGFSLAPPPRRERREGGRKTGSELKSSLIRQRAFIQHIYSLIRHGGYAALCD